MTKDRERRLTKQRLPTLAQEADIIAHLRANVRLIRDEKISFCGLTLSWFEKADTHQLLKQWLKTVATNPYGLIDIANLARAGWGLADEVLRDLNVEYEHNNVERPPTLKAYIMEVVDPRYRHHRTKGQQKFEFLLRDIAIVFLVGDVCWKFGIRPTRQRRSKPSKRERISGCSATELVMGEEDHAVSESTVVGAWTRLGRMAFGRKAFLNPKALGPYPF